MFSVCFVGFGRGLQDFEGHAGVSSRGEIGYLCLNRDRTLRVSSPELSEPGLDEPGVTGSRDGREAFGYQAGVEARFSSLVLDQRAEDLEAVRAFVERQLAERVTLTQHTKK